jgi:murein DD-endopeptidase MepM/ murein hydrolase activator NlpD
MARHYFRILAIAAGAFLGSMALPADTVPSQAPTVRVSPSRARPGDALLVTLDGVPPSSATSTSGTMVVVAVAPASGTASASAVPARRLRFFPTPTGAQAIAALPVEVAPGTLAVEVRIPGRPEPLVASVEVVAPAFPESQLSVEPKFFAPSPAQKKQMEADQAAFREAFARPFEPPLFAGPFDRPRDARVTGQYGERRIFNGQQKSQHYGTDLAGAVGDPVLATNDGVVVLVRDCFASGKSVAIAHGGGLFSVYFHLSDFDVRHGDRVRRGQPVGKVGMTGRVTGPHLHFGIKVVDLYVDPDSVYRLAFAAPSAPPAAGTPASP